jgi:hypothetical protein
VSDLFLQRNMIREATAFLLDALSGDRPEQAALQTKLLEVNLITNPQVITAISLCRSLWAREMNCKGTKSGKRGCGPGCIVGHAWRPQAPCPALLC